MDLDLDQESLDMALESLEDTVQEKAENIGRIIAQIDAENAAYKTEIDRLSAKKKSNEQKSMRVVEYLDFNLRAMEITKLDTPLFKFSYRKSEAVVVDDITLLTEMYTRTKTVVEADKSEIKFAIKSGIEVPGAHVEVKQNLQIK